MPPKYVRPTHFLAFPITNASCQARAQDVIDTLLQAKPRPDGVHESLAVSPQSLHLTLGIMPLMTEKEAQNASGSTSQPSKPLNTVQAAAQLLRDCRAGLRQLLEEDETNEIKINLNRLESFQSDTRKCRVLYAEPEKGSEGVETLQALAAYVRERFHQEGMLADYNQPLTLHATLMKASARKNTPSKQPRMTEQQNSKNIAKDIAKDNDHDTTTSDSDDVEAPNPVLEAEGVSIVGEQAINSLDSRKPGASSGSSNKPKADKKRRPRRGAPKNYPFDASLVLNAEPPYALGETLIDSIHLYQMRKKDEKGSYVVLGAIKLFD